MKALSDEAPVQSSPVPVQSVSLPDPASPLIRTSPLGELRSVRVGRGEAKLDEATLDEDPLILECVDIMCFMPTNSLYACRPVK